MFKRVTCILAAFLLFSGCSDTWSSVKRGLTGQKQNSIDEFLVKKKDPLVLPPEFDNLPTPNERSDAKAEISSFEQTLGNTSEIESPSTGGSTEDSILEKIKRQ
tara:strand:+ start:628 stop:939 length:312 start_codon:yes stop_codon:yes gene_type:complete